MTKIKGIPRVCSNGHKFYKTTDCPTCPVCEAGRKPETSFLAEVGAPARRALEREGITTIAKLAHYTETEILLLHGIGPSALPKLRKALQSQGMDFKPQPAANHRRF